MWLVLCFAGGRDGEVSTADGALKHRLAVPKQLGGKEEPGATNPEQLLAAGFSACFLSALGVSAKQQGNNLSSDASVKGRPAPPILLHLI